MGYEFYITRADDWPEDEHWSEGGRDGITFEEWERLVECDPELEIDHSDRLTAVELECLIDENPDLAGCRTEHRLTFSREQCRRLKELAKPLKQGEAPERDVIRYDTADWTAHPRGEERCFWYGDRMISTKDPDVATIDKLLQLAERLGALVRGEDGERYRRSDRGFDCFAPDRGWLPLEEFHRGRPLWAPTIIREIAERKATLS
jgi:hypothetical protein